MAKKREQTPLKKGASSFRLLGKAKIGNNTFNLDNESQTSDWIFSSMNIGVDTGNGNVVYANMMGGYGADRDNVLYVHGKDSDGKDDYTNSFTIDWDDRDDEDILETIGNGCFINIGVEKDSKGKIFRKRFLSAYDAIEYLNEVLEDGTPISVRGNLQYQYYKDSVTVNKNITSIYLSDADEDKYCATFEQTILLDKESIGRPDKEKGTIPIDAYVVDYVGKVDGEAIKENVSFAKTFELQVNQNKPDLTKRVLEKYFKVRKQGQIVELGVEGILQEGGNISTASIDDLPDDLKDMLDMELITEEEALAKCTDGIKERRMIIKRPLTRKGGDEEHPTITILYDDSKYVSDDLIFLDSLIGNSEDSDDYVEFDDGDDLPFDLDDEPEEPKQKKTKKTEKSKKVEETDDDDNDDWFQELLDSEEE